MRCYCCNKALSDFESTRRSALTGEFLDMCNDCFYTIKDDVDVVERNDLRHESDNEGETDDDYGL